MIEPQTLSIRSGSSPGVHPGCRYFGGTFQRAVCHRSFRLVLWLVWQGALRFYSCYAPPPAYRGILDSPGEPWVECDSTPRKGCLGRHRWRFQCTFRSLGDSRLNLKGGLDVPVGELLWIPMKVEFQLILWGETSRSWTLPRCLRINLIKMVKNTPNFLKTIITDYKSWCFAYYSETIKLSIQ